MTGAHSARTIHSDAAPALRAALDVLEHNWVVDHTVPARDLYPHQWSWDSAFAAIGRRNIDPARARTELRTLFDAQWQDGRLPQIVYAQGREDEYAPNAAFWASGDIPSSGSKATSGLVQPPIHALAVWLVHEADPQGSAEEHFLEHSYPALVRWHEYLRIARASRQSPALSVIRHPWESGTDNSPLWDAALSDLDADAAKADVSFARPDLLHAGAGERPDDAEYQRYYLLATRYRDAKCDDRVDIGFSMICPLFNSLLACSENALAAIVSAGDPLGGVAAGAAAASEHHSRAAEIAEALGRVLWDEDLGIYTALNERTGGLVRRATINGLLALLVPHVPHVSELLATLTGPRFLGGARFVPSYDATAPDFDPALYWRGPAWFNLNWLLMHATERLGRSDISVRLHPMFQTIAANERFPEYIDPNTAEAHGTRDFSWTAALTADFLTLRGRENPGSLIGARPVSPSWP